MRVRLSAYDRRIDAAFAGWVAHQLPPALQTVALRLPYAIGLARSRRWRSWCQVFHSPLVRAAPGLMAEAFPPSMRVLTDLGLAHAFGVLLAFLDDRANDCQAPLTRNLQLLRRAMEAEVTARFAAVIGDAPQFWHAVRRDAIAFLDAHGHEVAVWQGRQVGGSVYARSAAAKLPIVRWSVLAGAHAGGASETEAEQLATCADRCVIALQQVDDVVDWRDDFRAGRWTVFIHQHLNASERRRRSISEAELCRRVERGGVQEAFLAAALHQYRLCARHLERWPLTTWRAWVTEQQRWLAAWCAADGRRARFAASLARMWAA